MANKALPPDDHLKHLSALINGKLPERAAVNFYRLEEQTGMIFSSGVHRYVVIRPGVPGEDSVERIAQMVKDWMARTGGASKWTEDPSEAA